MGLGLLAALAVGAATAAPSRAATTAPVYGEVAHVGGFDAAANYGSTTTSNLKAGEFVDPLGMAVDDSAPSSPEIYVLDLVNPQAMNAASGGSVAGLKLTYRIQALQIGAGGAANLGPSTTFTLNSSSTTPDERAVAITVGGPGDDVDVLVVDDPGKPLGPGDVPDALQIDQWPTSLTGSGPAVVTPQTLQQRKTGLTGDLDGVSLAYAGTGATAELALGGTEYTGAGPVPAIETFTAAGALDRVWQDTPGSATARSVANPVAAQWGLNAGPQALYEMSANPDGSLNVALGPQTTFIFGAPGTDENGADFEPIMATVSSDLTTTAPVLPSPNTAPDAPTDPDFNWENGATDLTELDPGSTSTDQQDDGQFPAPSGGTDAGGALGPSVVALQGGLSFPDGLYAGLVDETNGGYYDGNDDPIGGSLGADPLEPDEFLAAWETEGFSDNGEAPNPSASFGIRVFNGLGQSVAMIGNQTASETTPVGACGLQGGSFGATQLEQNISMIALAPGANGAIYALVQPDLTDEADMVDPAHALAPYGDQVIEFTPVTPGAADECPQPTGMFAVSNANPALGPKADSGTKPIAVTAGTTLSFDASAIDLQGGVPWSYDWNLQAAGSADTADPTCASDGAPGTIANTFTANSFQTYDRATQLVRHTYSAPGTYTATLNLVNDFGTLTECRTIVVAAAGPTTAAFTAPATAVAGQPVGFDASGSQAPGADPFLDYHWNFGDGSSDDTAGPADTWVFQNAGTYTVTLTVSEAGGIVKSVSQQIVITPAPAVVAPVAPTAPPSPPAPTTGTGPTPRATNRSPTTLSPRVSAIRRATALKVTLACPATKVSCAGTVRVQTASAVPLTARRGARRRRLTLGSATFKLAAGATRALTVRLSKRLAPALAFLQLVKLQITVSAHDSYGDAKTQRLTYYLTAPPSHTRPRRFG